MRLFAAVALNDDVRAAVGAEQRRLLSIVPPLRSAARWVHPDQMHLTLVFIGDVADADVTSLAAKFANPVLRPRFELTLSGIGMFPPRGAPRVLWLGISAGTTELDEVQQIVRSRISSAGLAVEPKPFRPHLTLARFRESQSGLRRPLADVAGDGPSIARLPVDEVVLFESRLPTGRGASGIGPTYTAVARAQLRCS